jgi:hypothetical protein
MIALVLNLHLIYQAADDEKGVDRLFKINANAW